MYYLNLIENQPDIDKIYLCAKDPYEAKSQYLTNKREGVGIDQFNNPKAFIEYPNDMCDVYKNINYYNPDKESKILIVFYDMIADMIVYQRKKLNFSLVFITESYFKVPKDVRLNTTRFFFPQKF